MNTENMLMPIKRAKAKPNDIKKITNFQARDYRIHDHMLPRDHMNTVTTL